MKSIVVCLGVFYFVKKAGDNMDCVESQEIEQVEVYENEFEILISDFCEKYNIDNMATETQNRWNACLSYIYKNMFKGTDKLKYKPNINNEYNTSILLYILDCYIDICNTYSKEISVNGYSKLTGIEYFTIMLWKNKPSSKGFEIYRKLMQENENSNSDLLSSGRNPVGIMARLNHVHNWSAQQVQAETIARSISAAELPNFQNAKQIEEK